MVNKGPNVKASAPVSAKEAYGSARAYVADCTGSLTSVVTVETSVASDRLLAAQIFRLL